MYKERYWLTNSKFKIILDQPPKVLVKSLTDALETYTLVENVRNCGHSHFAVCNSHVDDYRTSGPNVMFPCRTIGVPTFKPGSIV